MLRFSTIAVIALCGTAAAFDQPPSAEDVAYFESRIRPLLVKRCYECHSGEAKTLKGGLRLDQADLLRKGGDSGEAVVPGKPDESLLITAVRYTDAALHMPPAGKLPESEIAELTEWVKRGAPFPKATTTANPGTKRTIDIEEGKRFWSFRPLTRSNPPPIKDAAWPQRRVDAYLLAALESRHLSASPPPDRRTLIRRLYFDVVGLPPSPEDVEEFVADASPEAWSRLVDRLLASPRYGERWGRYWLDLVRYCDVPEQWAKTDAQAWLYRDWVVQSLNDDLPYDQFVIRQFAADQLPDFQPRDVAALGFLGLSPSYWKELKLAPDVIKTVVAEEWEERITAVSGTLLGLTVGCARCHDHKFDPVTQQDYYALAGIFASIRQAPLPMLPLDEGHRVAEAHVQLKLLEQDIERFTAMAKRDKDKAEEWNSKVAEAKAKIEQLKQTPHFGDSLVYAVEDAALAVLPDGPDRTKLEYQPGAGQDVAMQVRGNPARPADVVPRRFLSVLSPGEPARFTQGSGRREFAEAIFRDSAPLAARVIANRVWRHHFGRGLVETVSNFGVQGSRPTHPELLDDLAERFIESGWSLKWLHRELLLSAAYQQSSALSEPLRAVDPDNLLLGRMSRRRLDVEAWRDAMLSATGTLDPRIGGPSQDLSEAGHVRRAVLGVVIRRIGMSLDLAEAGHVRRTLYATIRRRELADLLRLYDFPDPMGHSPSRIDTTTPLQQLFVLNSDFLGRQAEALLQRIRRERPPDAAGERGESSPRNGVLEQIGLAHLLLYSRAASDRELELAEKYLGESPTDAMWREYLEVLLARNELMFVD